MNLIPRNRSGLVAACAIAALCWAPYAAVAGIRPQTPPQCDRACLIKKVRTFERSAIIGTLPPDLVSRDAEIRENGVVIELADSAWRKVKLVRSRVWIADPQTGNVAVRAGVELRNG